MSPKKQCDQYVYVCLFCFLFFCFTEIEAKEACDWLRAAGFPQYAQLYEGNAHTHTQSGQHAASFHTKPCPSKYLCSLLLIFFLSDSLSYFFFPSSLFLSLFPPSLHLCIPVFWAVLFPGFSSCPEGGVMGKALLSLLGLSQLLFLSSFFHLSSSSHPPLFFQSSLCQSVHFITFDSSFFIFCLLFNHSFLLPSCLPTFLENI